MTSSLALALEREGISSETELGNLTRRLVWARDASHFRILPSETHRARSLDEVARLLALANQSQTPVTFRSGGSSLSGQTVGHGLVLDTRSGFQSIIEIGQDSVKAEPGVTLARVNGHLARKGLKIGPDPASMVASTLGGAVNNNSSGMTCGTKFNSYATIRSARILFSDGTEFDTSSNGADEVLRQLKPEVFEALETVRDRIRGDRKLSKRVEESFRLKNTMGYSLNAFLDFDSPSEILLHLLVGSEGTLAFLGEVELATLPLREHKAAHLLLFKDLKDASTSVPKIMKHEPSAIELMDATSLRALLAEGMLSEPLASHVTETSSALLVEFEAASRKDLSTSSARFEKEFAKWLVFASAEGELRNQLWSMRKGLYAIVAKARPEGTTALLEDVAVPPEKLPQACDLLSKACVSHGYGKPVIFGHVRDGNIHFMISDDFGNQERVEAFKQFTNQMVEIVLGLGGNLKAEHGTGRAMAPFVERQFGSELYVLLKQLKQAFDPNGILNPGVIFPASETDYLENLKSVAKVSEIVDSCVECGYCESSCPSEGLTLTPRERIVVNRELEGLSLSVKRRLEDELHYAVNQTCAVDGMCAVNCPVGINTGSLVKELRSNSNGRLSTLLAAAIESNWGKVTNIARAGLKTAQLVPGVSGPISAALASILPKGLIPTWSKNVVSKGFSRTSLKGNSSEVAFLPSCMNEIFGEAELEKFLELSSQLGHPLEIPTSVKGFCCGTPFSSKGLSSATDRRHQRNRLILNQLPHKTVVIDGSSCHQTLLEQEPGRVIELGQFVATNLLGTPVKRKFERIVLHPTCSGEKTGSNRAMAAIAETISEEVIVPADWRCCGYAGDRGMLIPELTANATKLEALEVSELDAVFVSNNQPCQSGMSGATQKSYRSILSAWIEAVS